MSDMISPKKIFDEIEVVLEKNGVTNLGGILLLETEHGLMNFGSKFERLNGQAFALVLTEIMKNAFGTDFTLDALKRFAVIGEGLEKEIHLANHTDILH